MAQGSTSFIVPDTIEVDKDTYKRIIVIPRYVSSYVTGTSVNFLLTGNCYKNDTTPITTTPAGKPYTFRYNLAAFNPTNNSIEVSSAGWHVDVDFYCNLPI